MNFFNSKLKFLKILLPSSKLNEKSSILIASFKSIEVSNLLLFFSLTNLIWSRIPATDFLNKLISCIEFIILTNDGYILKKDTKKSQG